jgi:predicted RND superfamily exporter protein
MAFLKRKQKKKVQTHTTASSSFYARTAAFILKYRWIIIVVNFLLVLGAFAGMGIRGNEWGAHEAYLTHVRNNPLDVDPDHKSPPPIFNPDYRVYFEKDNEDLLAYEQFQEIFSKEDMVFIVMTVKNGDIFTNENLASLKELTDRAWEIPFINRSSGLTNFNYTSLEREMLNPDDEYFTSDQQFIDNLVVEDFIYDLPLDNETLAVKKQLALNDPVLSKFFVSKNGDIGLVALRAVVPEDFTEGYIQIRDEVEALVADVAGKNKNIKIHLGGTAILNTSFQKYTQKDQQTTIPLMFLFICAVLLLTLRSLWAIILPMVLLVTTVIFPVTLIVGWLKFSLTAVSIQVIQMLVAIAIADSVHVLTVYYRELRAGQTKKAAISITIQKNLLPCFITTVTTAIGFYSLMFQPNPPTKDLGFLAGTGTLYAFFASLYTMPAILSVLPFKKPKKARLQKKKYLPFFDVIPDFVEKNQVALRWGSFVAVAISAFFIFNIVVDTTAHKYFKKGTDFREASDYINANMMGTFPLEFNFQSGRENGICDPEFLHKIEDFEKHIMSQPDYEATYVASILDVIKRINKTMNQDLPEYYKIPDNGSVTSTGEIARPDKLISQYLLMYTLSLPQGMDLNNQMNLDKSSARVTVFLRSMSTEKFLRISNGIDAWLSKNMPEVKAKSIGTPVMFGNMWRNIVPGLLVGIVVSLVLITLTLMLTFKSIKNGLISIVSNVWPIIVIFGIVGMIGRSANLSIALVSLIVFGIIVDDTVHFLVKYLAARREGKLPKESIRWTFQQCGDPLFYTSVILVCGFSVLTFSSFTGNSDLGLFCSIIILLALFADFFILPAFLLKFDRAKAHPKQVGTLEESELKTMRN